MSGNFPKSSAFSEVAEHWIEMHSHLLSPSVTDDVFMWLRIGAIGGYSNTVINLLVPIKAGSFFSS